MYAQIVGPSRGGEGDRYCFADFIESAVLGLHGQPVDAAIQGVFGRGDWRIAFGRLAVEDERYARGISTPAAVDGGAYGGCAERVGLWK